MGIVNAGNVVGVLRSPTPPVKRYVLWFKWLNYPSTPEVGSLFTYDNGLNDWVPIQAQAEAKAIDLDIVPYPLEKGIVASGVQLVFSMTPQESPVVSRNLLKNITPINSPSTDSGVYDYVGNISFLDSLANRTFKYSCVLESGTLETTKVVTFEAPSYYGILALASINETSIKTLSKNIWAKTDRMLSFSPILNRFVYAYPKSFGLLRAIVDQNNISIISEFTVIELSFLLADSETYEEYYVYYNNDNTTQTNFLLDFKF